MADFLCFGAAGRLGSSAQVERCGARRCCLVLHWFLQPDGAGFADAVADGPVDCHLCGHRYSIGHFDEPV